MGTDGQENGSTGWPRCAAHLGNNKLHRCEGKLSCRECWTGITNMQTRMESGDGAAKCDHLVMAGDAVS